MSESAAEPALTPLVDTHCHLQSPRFDEDRDAVIARNLDALAWCVTIGGDLESNAAALELVRPRLHAVLGFHPYHAAQVDDGALDALRAHSTHPQVIAIGEMGLDYFNEFAPREVQAHAFRRQLDLAVELQLPIVIHNREADADCHAMLREYAPQLAGCVMHCFSSGPAEAEQFLGLGFYISFAGNVTFNKAQPLRDAAQRVPLERLLVETDAPYLAPMPLRGKRCEPFYVQHTAARLAQTIGVAPQELAKRTTENAHRFYGIPLP